MSAEILYSQKPISIHAPRTGSDTTAAYTASTALISIHAPRTGSDVHRTSQTVAHSAFQSTLPARGATSTVSDTAHASTHFNPRSPHGERRKTTLPVDSANDFNPRSPHGERHLSIPVFPTWRLFQSTLPARGATVSEAANISPHGAFQSTLPARGATTWA